MGGCTVAFTYSPAPPDVAQLFEVRGSGLAKKGRGPCPRGFPVPRKPLGSRGSMGCGAMAHALTRTGGTAPSTPLHGLLTRGGEGGGGAFSHHYTTSVYPPPVRWGAPALPTPQRGRLWGAHVSVVQRHAGEERGSPPRSHVRGGGRGGTPVLSRGRAGGADTNPPQPGQTKEGVDHGVGSAPTPAEEG